MVNTLALDELLKDNRAREEGRPKDRTLSRHQLAYGTVVAADPSLSATGILTLEHDVDGLRVTRSDTLKPEAPEGYTGFRKDTAEAIALKRMVGVYIARYASIVPNSKPEPWVVREAPPVGGGKFVHSESSIQAGLVFELEAIDLGFEVLPMVYVAGHRARIVGGKPPKGMSKKDYHRDHLMPLVRGMGVQGLELVTNEDLRDALAVGLTSLAQKLERP